MARPRLLPDTYTLALIGMVVLASVLPVQGAWASAFGGLTTLAIGGLFFLHGAKLSRQAIFSGLLHWRLHVVIFLATFALFPLLGLALRPVLQPLVTPQLYQGVLYLCVMPATVQSAIAFTSLARGNIAAAVCSASASTLVGIFVSPPLVEWLVQPASSGAMRSGDGMLDAIVKIMLQLLLPFVLGHLCRPWIGAWLQRNAGIIRYFDQGSILLVVYTAFSAAVIEGLWRTTPLSAVLGLLVIACVILALALAATTFGARWLGFDKEDEITIVFCGSKKSLASGIPMAKVLFPPAAVGPMVLPLMLFHQLQLMVCAVLAQRYARRPGSPEAPGT